MTLLFISSPNSRRISDVKNCEKGSEEVEEGWKNSTRSIWLRYGFFFDVLDYVPVLNVLAPIATRIAAASIIVDLERLLFFNNSVENNSVHSDISEDETFLNYHNYRGISGGIKSQIKSEISISSGIGGKRCSSGFPAVPSKTKRKGEKGISRTKKSFVPATEEIEMQRR